MKLRTILSIMAFVTWYAGLAQSVQIDRIDVRGNKIIVRYILNDDISNHKYSISLYSSADNFSKPLTKVSGDVGPDVRPGDDKKIIWDIASEIGDFKGSVSLEIRGSVVAAFLQFSDSDMKPSYKRGKNYPLRWTSGNAAGQLNIELYKGNELTWKASNVPNNGSYSWTIPAKIKTGKGYQLKFVNSNDEQEFVYSQSFAIKPKTSMVVKVGAVALIGVGVSLMGGGGKSGGDNSGGGSKLPDPPTAPGG